MAIVPVEQCHDATREIASRMVVMSRDAAVLPGAAGTLDVENVRRRLSV